MGPSYFFASADLIRDLTPYVDKHGKSFIKYDEADVAKAANKGRPCHPAAQGDHRDHLGGKSRG